MLMYAAIAALCHQLSGWKPSRSTIGRAAKKGELQAERVGRYWAATAEAVSAFAAKAAAKRNQVSISTSNEESIQTASVDTAS
jgi:hypothetical protein